MRDKSSQWPQQSVRDLDHIRHLHVRTGKLPYASTYGKKERMMTIGAFIDKWMVPGPECNITTAVASNATATPVPPGLDRGSSTHTAISRSHEALLAAYDADATGSHPCWTRPPIANGSYPSYVFDGAVANRYPNLFERWLQHIPPFLFQKRHGMRQMIMGPAGSGAMLHFHGSATNLLGFGLKLWAVSLPSQAAFSDLHAWDWFRQQRAQASASLSNVTQAGNMSAGEPQYTYFLQHPGDVVFVPEHYGHAVINIADSLAFAVE